MFCTNFTHYFQVSKNIILVTVGGAIVVACVAVDLFVSWPLTTLDSHLAKQVSHEDGHKGGQRSTKH